MPDRLLPFLAVVAVLTITPGPDMALVLRNGISGGSRGAWRTGLGCCAGIAVHATLAVVGLSALLVASATAFTAVKLAGAGYLVYLGVRSLLAARRSGAEAATDDVDGMVPDASPEGLSPFRQGLMTNLLNPKIAVLFLTLIPQFVAPDENAFGTTTTLAVVFLATAVLWWRVFSLAVGGLGRVLSREPIRRRLDQVTGGVLVALGLRVALAD